MQTVFYSPNLYRLYDRKTDSGEKITPQETRRPAGPAFPPGTYHEVSMGLEQWSGEYLPVVKVRTRQGVKSTDRGLSVPIGSRDHHKIIQAIEDLLSEDSLKA